MPWRLKSPASTIVYSTDYSRSRSKKTSKLHWPLWGEFISDRWIPRTKSQERGKCFHLMTLSCTSTTTITISEETTPLHIRTGAGLHTFCALLWLNMDATPACHIDTPAIKIYVYLQNWFALNYTQHCDTPCYATNDAQRNIMRHDGLAITSVWWLLHAGHILASGEISDLYL